MRVSRIQRTACARHLPLRARLMTRPYPHYPPNPWAVLYFLGVACGTALAVCYTIWRSLW